MLSAAFAVFWFKDSKATLSNHFEKDLVHWQKAASDVNYNLNDSGLVSTIRHFLKLDSTTLVWIGIGLLAYGIIEMVECVGLWMLRRWAEYLAVVATSAGLPIEIYELARGFTVDQGCSCSSSTSASCSTSCCPSACSASAADGVAFEAERASESLLEVEKAAALLPDDADEPIPTPVEHT